MPAPDSVSVFSPTEVKASSMPDRIFGNEAIRTDRPIPDPDRPLNSPGRKDLSGSVVSPEVFLAAAPFR